jgi:N-formylmaleamate deformylase
MLENWARQEIMINGDCFFYRRTSVKEGFGKPVMVLMHGFSDNGLCWQPMAEELEDSYDIILPDARGHGLSARVNMGEKVDPAQDLVNLLDTLHVSAVILGGHSMGAGVAANVAARFPERVRALILEDPPWSMPSMAMEEEDEGQAPHPLQDFVQSLQGKSLEQLMAQYRGEHSTWPEIVLLRWCEAKQQLDPKFLSTNGLGWADWQQILPAIRCPVLLITAEVEKGSIITAQVAERAAEVNPHLQAVHIPNAGHHVRFENPGDYMQAVHTFLRKIN